MLWHVEEVACGGAHQHLGLGEAGLEVEEMEGGVKGEEADLGAVIAREAVKAVSDGLADNWQRARLHRLCRNVYHKKEARRHRRPDLRPHAAALTPVEPSP